MLRRTSWHYYHQMRDRPPVAAWMGERLAWDGAAREAETPPPPRATVGGQTGNRLRKLIHAPVAETGPCVTFLSARHQTEAGRGPLELRRLKARSATTSLTTRLSIRSRSDFEWGPNGRLFPRQATPFWCCHQENRNRSTKGALFEKKQNDQHHLTLKVLHASQSDFDLVVLQSASGARYFYADWWPVLAMSPVLDQLAAVPEAGRQR